MLLFLCYTFFMNYIIPIISFVLGNLTAERIKNIFKNEYDLSKSEREFYDEIIKIIYEFIAEIKKYELEKKIRVTKNIILADSTLKKQYQEFMDFANEFIGKSFVFLNEENYKNLKNALNHDNFADLANDLLYAMRKSLYPDTKLHPTNDLKEFQY